jgi:GntR family transcriptional regulator
MGLVRRNTQAIYVQIAESLAQQIRSGDLQIGDRLPPERQLAEELGVSRMTVRQALALLEEQGLIERLPGVGSFVCKPKIEQPVDVLIGFSHNLLRRGFQPGARLLKLELQRANRPVAEALCIAVGEPVYFIHRLRLANNLPVALEFSFFPARLCPRLEAHDLTHRSIYTILIEEYGIHLQGANQVLEPTTARPYEAHLLKIPEGSPLMLIRRISYGPDQQPIEYAKDLYRGDCFRFIVRSYAFEWWEAGG